MRKVVIATESPKTVNIEKSREGEYRVPDVDGFENGAYYTEDSADAVATAKKMWGPGVKFNIRLVNEFVGGKYDKYRSGTSRHDFKRK